MNEVLEKLEQARDHSFGGDKHLVIVLLSQAIEILAHKVQELEPEQYTEEDMIPFISDDGKREARDKLAEELCKALHYEYITDKTQMLVDQLRELIDASKEP
jgi:uncharacterized protein (DUF1697 family)